MYPTNSKEKPSNRFKDRDITRVDPSEYERLVKSTSNANFSLLEQSILQDRERKVLDRLDAFKKKRKLDGLYTLADNDNSRSIRHYDSFSSRPNYNTKKHYLDQTLDKTHDLDRRARDLANQSYRTLGNRTARNILDQSTMDQTRLQNTSQYLVDNSTSRLEHMKQNYSRSKPRYLSDEDIKPKVHHYTFEELYGGQNQNQQSFSRNGLLSQSQPNFVNPNSMLDNRPPSHHSNTPQIHESKKDPKTASFGKPQWQPPAATSFFQSGNQDVIKQMLQQREKETTELRHRNRQLENTQRRKEDLIEKMLRFEQNQPGPPPQAYAFKAPPPARRPPRRPAGDPRALLQNNSRNKDLNDFERAFVFLNAQESDNLKMLMNVPVGTDLYRYKVEQLKETSTTRSEVEKLAYEQMLKQMKKGQEAHYKELDRMQEHLRWDDEMRRVYLQDRMRKDLAPFPKLEFQLPGGPEDEDEDGDGQGKGSDDEDDQPRRYDSTEGFIVYWDYILNMTEDCEYTNYDFQIVCNGQILRSMESMPEAKNVLESVTQKRVIFGEKSIIKGIPINPDTLMIWKVRKKVPGSDKEEYVGWTQIDLFDLANNLKRGRWKCPLYTEPYDTNITKAGVKLLTRNGEWYYLRIGYYPADEFAKGSLAPAQSSRDAEIPEIHLRDETWQPPKGRDPPDEDKPPEDPPAQPKDPEADPTRAPKEQAPLDVRFEEPQVPLIDKAPKDPSTPPTPLPSLKMGITVEILKILRYEASSHLKVSMVCFQNRIPITDDTQIPWKRNTILHNPFMGQEKEGIKLVESEEAKKGLMFNLADDQDIIFQEKKQIFRLLRNFPIMFQKSDADVPQEHTTLVFFVEEKPRPEEVLKIENKGYNEGGSANLGGLEFKIKAFATMRLDLKDSRTARNGKIELDLYEPSFRIPPYNYEKKCKKTGATILIDVEDLKYKTPDVEKEYEDYSLKPRQPYKAEKVRGDKRRTEQGKTKDGRSLSTSPYIKNTEKQSGSKLFEDGFGIDFYLDTLRFLPDNTTIVKAAIRILNSESEDMFDLVYALPQFRSSNDALNPVFDFRFEYRAASFDPTSIIMMTFVTIDDSNNENRLVGHSAINLFEKAFSDGGQPESSNETSYILKSGAYQVSIYSQEPLEANPFNINKIAKLVRLPLASVLLRINPAPFKDDRKSVLSKNDFPRASRQELHDNGIWPFRPLYGEGVYNNEMNILEDAEIKLLPYREKRKEKPILDRLDEMLLLRGVKGLKSLRDKFRWCSRNINFNSKTFMLDRMFFAQYQAQAGLKLAIDAIHNLPKDLFYFVQYTLNPPGAYYTSTDLSDDRQKHNTKDVFLVQDFDWSRPLGLIKYFEGWKHYTDLEYNPYLHFIVEIKYIKSHSNGSFSLAPFGWCVIPIFHNNQYVYNGHFQMPIYKGAFPYTKLRSVLTKNEPFTYLEQLRRSKNPDVQWRGNCSLLYRLLDNQKDGELEDTKDEGKLSVQTIDYRFLPQDLTTKTKFAYNEQVERILQKKRPTNIWRSLLPEGQDEENYKQTMLANIIEDLQLENENVLSKQ